MGDTSSNGGFPIAMLVYRNVNEHQSTIYDDLKKVYLVSNMAILGVSY